MPRTPGTAAALNLMLDAIFADPGEAETVPPSGTAFVPTDTDWSSNVTVELRDAGRPVILVGGDGSSKLHLPPSSSPVVSGNPSSVAILGELGFRASSYIVVEPSEAADALTTYA